MKPPGVPEEEDSGSEDANLEVDSATLDVEKERKRAGLPPLELDSLPSTTANKMMILCLTMLD